MKQITDKKQIQIVKKLIGDIRRDFGKPCKELNVDCGVCKATILIAYLEWYIDVLE